jgi:hypothetical protein
LSESRTFAPDMAPDVDVRATRSRVRPGVHAA